MELTNGVSSYQRRQQGLVYGEEGSGQVLLKEEGKRAVGGEERGTMAVGNARQKEEEEVVAEEEEEEEDVQGLFKTYPVKEEEEEQVEAGCGRPGAVKAPSRCQRRLGGWLGWDTIKADSGDSASGGGKREGGGRWKMMRERGGSGPGMLVVEGREEAVASTLGV